ncbi:MAG: nuclear transport factor 2 family protein [Actinobacteria bacterium]|nr:nuclear transport factor 2 family protein [Actinomycetota bacterium]
MSDSIDTFLQDWSRAELTGDTDTLDRLLTDDYTAVGPLGFILPKAAWLGRHRGGDLHYEAFSVDEPAVRPLGPVAVVTATNHTEASYQGHPVPGVLRVTLILTSGDRGWQLAANHMSFVAGTPGAPPIPGQAAAGSAS